MIGLFTGGPALKQWKVTMAPTSAGDRFKIVRAEDYRVTQQGLLKFSCGDEVVAEFRVWESVQLQEPGAP